MTNSAVLLPITHELLKKTIENLDTKHHGKLKNSINEDELLNEAEEILLNDRKFARSTKILASEINGESQFVSSFRGLVRPIVTVSLTAAFILLLIALSQIDEGKGIEKAITIFLAVYGPILGFWFGQQTALKSPSALKNTKSNP